MCIAYQYKGTRPENCILIQSKCTEFVTEQPYIIYEKGHAFQTDTKK